MTTSDEAITHLILEIFRLNGRLLGSGDALVRDIGLTSARWQVLGAIVMSSVPLTVAHLARNMGLTRQAVQRVVNEMKEEGLVHFGPNPHHQRSRLVFIASQGEKAYQAAMKRQGPWAARLAIGLDLQQIEAARTVLQEIRQCLEELPQEEDRA